MFSKDDYVVYRHDVCRIVDFKNFNNRNYYVLKMLKDESLTINVPTHNCNIRALISKGEINDIIKKIPSIPVITVDSKMIDAKYKSLFEDGSYESLISIIKTAYLVNNERILNKKKIRDKDDYYFRLAEEYLYNEFSIVLGMSYDDTKNYVISEVSKLVWSI